MTAPRFPRDAGAFIVVPVERHQSDRAYDQHFRLSVDHIVMYHGNGPRTSVVRIAGREQSMVVALSVEELDALVRKGTPSADLAEPVDTGDMEICAVVERGALCGLVMVDGSCRVHGEAGW